MAVTRADIYALAPGGRLEGERFGDVRVAVERSEDGASYRWVRETLDADGRVTGRVVGPAVRMRTQPRKGSPAPGVTASRPEVDPAPESAKPKRGTRGRFEEERPDVNGADVRFRHRLRSDANRGRIGGTDPGSHHLDADDDHED